MALVCSVLTWMAKNGAGRREAQPVRYIAVPHSSRGGREIVGAPARRLGDTSAEADPGAIGAGAGISQDVDRTENQPGA